MGEKKPHIFSKLSIHSFYLSCRTENATEPEGMHIVLMVQAFEYITQITCDLEKDKKFLKHRDKTFK